MIISDRDLINYFNISSLYKIITQISIMYLELNEKTYLLYIRVCCFLVLLLFWICFFVCCCCCLLGFFWGGWRVFEFLGGFLFTFFLFLSFRCVCGGGGGGVHWTEL